MTTTTHRRRLCTLLLPLVVAACGGPAGDGDDSSGDGDGDGDQDVYAFESRFEPGTSSVSYTGQSFRQVLIVSMKSEISAIQTGIQEDGEVFSPGEVEARLLFYFEFDSAVSLGVEHGIDTEPPPLQSTFGDISEGVDLIAKVAGNDEVGQHKDWSTSFVGWETENPEALIRSFVAQLDAMAVSYSGGTVPLDPTGAAIDKFYVSEQGLDYQQLLEKTLLGAINFSQGTDDYLDDTEEGKGLLADNSGPDGDAPYTALEHAWDEGFGYWGGARDYLAYSDDELAGAEGRAGWANGYHDSNEDGATDLSAEYNFAAAVNAAKRDRGSADGSPTDFSDATMSAFLAGRRIISQADGALDGDQMAALVEQRDIVVENWEYALSATAVHYVNDVLRDMNAAQYSFVDHAKHWAELKGFLLMLQFSPHSPLGAAQLAAMHDTLGERPVFPEDANAAQYQDGLRSLRASLGSAYGFDSANLGDELGENGW